jgi:hypothetical protein
MLEWSPSKPSNSAEYIGLGGTSLTLPGPHPLAFWQITLRGTGLI